MRKIFFTFFISTFFSVALYAQTETIDADRPGQGDGAGIVPKKWVQFEGGFSYQKDNIDESELQIPTLLIRYGLSKKIELRLITTYFSHSSVIIPTGTQFKTGFQPIQIGTKILLCQQKSFLPKTSLLFHAGIPVLSSKNFTTKTPSINTKLSFLNNISETFSLSYNAGVQWDGDNSPANYFYTFSPGLNITKTLAVFIEAYGSFADTQLPQHGIDGGFTLLPNKNIQLDISSGFGITQSSPQWFISSGASIKFNTRKNNL